jgi:CheY-like chemotaxis protein
MQDAICAVGQENVGVVRALRARPTPTPLRFAEGNFKCVCPGLELARLPWLVYTLPWFPKVGQEAEKMPRKILIVDDEPNIRTLLRQAFEDFEADGVGILETGEGEEAWRVIQAERPDVIILDIMMPGLSGYEVCQRVKSDRALSKTHVIILTAKGQAADRRCSFEVGADEFILKPFDTADLIKRVANALDIAL